MAEKPQFQARTSPKKLRFTENDGFGWIDLGNAEFETSEIGRKACQKWPKNGPNHCDCSSSRATCRSRRPPSEDETPVVRSPTAALPLSSAHVQ